ncbi:MAG: lysophospholipid acyltransferase family protein [Fastidiosipilaceae bacterium]|jgi:1-acyl-sn-glycerol-3-phosphate acyltransferase
MNPSSSGVNRFLYSLVKVVSRCLLTPLMGIRVKPNAQIRRLNGPFLVVANHVNLLDPLFAAYAVGSRTIRFVAGEEVFRNGIAHKFARSMGLILRPQMRPDFSSTRDIIRAIRGDEVVLVFPEGQRSLNGEGWPLQDNLGVLIQKLNVPVVALKINGGYLSWPRWSKSWIRPGRIEIESRILFQDREPGDTSVENIMGAIAEAIYTDDNAWQRGRAKPVRFLSFAPAGGLQNICHRCPKCKRPMTMVGRRDQLICESCEYRARLLADGRFSDCEFENPAEWTRWQMSFALSEPNDFGEIVCRADRRTKDGDREDMGEGRLVVRESELIWESVEPTGKETKKVRERFSLPKQGVRAAYGKFFDLYQPRNDRTWTITPQDGRAVMFVLETIERQLSKLSDSSASSDGEASGSV